MEFNQKRAKEASIDTGAAVAGAVAGLAVSNKLTEMATANASTSAYARHLPALLLAAVIAVQALDVVPDNPLIDSALQGVSVVTGMQVVREYTGANTAAGRAATSGLPALINQYVPAFDAEGTNSAAMVVASTVTPATGVNGLGLINYRDPAQAALLGGRSRSLNGTLKTLGNAPSPVKAALADLG